jgi:hypothetical protein
MLNYGLTVMTIAKLKYSFLYVIAVYQPELDQAQRQFCFQN